MASSINADNGVSSGSAGLKSSADSSGVLQLQTNGTTAVTIDASQNVTFAGAVSSSGNQTVTGNLTVNGNTTLGDASTDTVLMNGAPSIGGAGYGMGMGFRNRIINGAMAISQRGTSFTSTGYATDRWNQSLSTPSSYSASQSSTAPTGFTKSLAITVTTGGTIGGSLNYIVQFIEGNNVADLGFGTSSASTITISFWVRSSVTGTFGGALRNYVAGSASSFRGYPFTYSISASNTWEYKTVTIAGDGASGSGQWNTDSNGAFSLFFDLGSGAATGTAGSWGSNNVVGATGTQTSLMTTNGATFYITGVQLEKGSTATSFDFRDYGRELILCQRYYQQITGNGVTTNYFGYAVAVATNQAYITVPLVVTMRSSPTVAYTGSVYISDLNNYDLAITAINNNRSNTAFASSFVTCTNGMTVYRPQSLWVSGTTNNLNFSAEL